MTSRRKLTQKVSFLFFLNFASAGHGIVFRCGFFGIPTCDTQCRSRPLQEVNSYLEAYLYLNFDSESCK